MDALSEDAWCKQVYADCAPQLLARLRRGFGYRVRAGDRRFLRLVSDFEREEVVQETYCRFLAQVKRGTFDKSRDPAPYFYRIGFNTALRYAGKLSREIPVEDLMVDEHNDAPVLEDASEKLIREERAAQVRVVLTTLSEEDLRVFRLTYEDDLSQAKVGEQVGLSRDQVYRVLTSIRKRVTDHVRGLGWMD